MKRAGISLLEVILALAILGGAMAAISTLVRVGSRSAVEARELSTAQLLCETKLAEITAGILPPDPGGPFYFEMPEHVDWVYFVDLQPLPQPGMAELTVHVEQVRLDGGRPVWFSLVRWIQDPMVEIYDPLLEEESAPTSDPTLDAAMGGTSGL